MTKQIAVHWYFITWGILVLLAALSLGLSFVHWPSGFVATSLAVATVKAALVGWFFMHLAEQRFANRLVLVVSALMFALLISLTALDVATRHTFPKAQSPAESSVFYRR